MVKKWKLALLTLTGTFFICLTSCALATAALAGGAWLIAGGATPAQ